MTYSSALGFKEGDTSRAAAEAMSYRGKTLRKTVYACIVINPGLTADEIAARLGESVLAIRPRVSELRASGLITQDGRGKNKSGASAHRWKAL